LYNDYASLICIDRWAVVGVFVS